MDHATHLHEPTKSAILKYGVADSIIFG